MTAAAAAAESCCLKPERVLAIAWETEPFEGFVMEPSLVRDPDAPPVLYPHAVGMGRLEALPEGGE